MRAEKGARWWKIELTDKRFSPFLPRFEPLSSTSLNNFLASTGVSNMKQLRSRKGSLA